MKLKLFYAFVLSLFLLNCSKSDSGGGSTSTAKSCAVMPSGITIDPASVCTSSSGKWSMFTVDQENKMAYQSCNYDETSLYKDQADFNANEGTSTVPSIVITSNNDYVKNSNCASGSTVYVNSGSTTHYLYLWEKAQ